MEALRPRVPFPRLLIPAVQSAPLLSFSLRSHQAVTRARELPATSRVQPPCEAAGAIS